MTDFAPLQRLHTAVTFCINIIFYLYKVKQIKTAFHLFYSL